MIDKGRDGFYHPADEAELTQLILRAKSEGLKIRVRGSAHSVPAAIYTGNFKEPPPDEPGLNVMLDRLNRIEFDDAKMQVKVQGGCHFGKDPFDPAKSSTVKNSLVYQLQEHGWALPATGGIIHQTMGGFLSTGSSGGSLQYSLSAAIVAIELIDGSGNHREFRRSEDDDDPFFAVGVSMGLLGVITSVTFQCEPTFNIEGTETTTSYERCAYELFSAKASNKPTLAEFFRTGEYGRCMWWPQNGIRKIIIWQASRLKGAPKEPFPQPYHEFLAFPGKSTRIFNTVIGMLMWTFRGLNPPGPKSRVGRLFNSIVVARLFTLMARIFMAGAITPPQEFREAWGDGLPMDNRVDYNWMPTEFSEMWVPVDQTMQVMETLRDYYKRNPISKVGNYTVEIYPTPRSRFWLSAAYQEDVVKFDMFWFGKNEGNPAEVFYPQFWEIMMPFQCRFHWGKYMPIAPDYLREQYPRWEQFMALRQEMDPHQVFVTNYWRERLGIRPAPLV